MSKSGSSWNLVPFPASSIKGGERGVLKALGLWGKFFFPQYSYIRLAPYTHNLAMALPIGGNHKELWVDYIFISF
jgi:hypothetical protein